MDCVFDFFPVSNQSSNTNINDDLPKEDLTRYGKKNPNNIIIMLWNIKQFSLFIMFFWKILECLSFDLRSYTGRNVATTDVQIEDQLDSHLNEHSETQCNSCQFYSNNSL